MKTLLPSSSVIFVLAAAVVPSAQAEYRCDPAPSWVDREACRAAAESARELRLFVEKMNSIRVNIRFADYVNQATADSWSRNKMAARTRTEEEPKLASAQTR
jgi:hypothetical protein